MYVAGAGSVGRGSGSNRVWAITCYYPFDDPPGVKRRLKVYREFRKHLRAPLAAIELTLDGKFDLNRADADVLVQVSGGDLMWQKERLLNRVLEVLPPECDTVAWADCDVILERSNWPAEARCLLDDCVLVQPFERLFFLSAGECPGERLELSDSAAHRSAASRWVKGTVPEEFFHGRGGTGILYRCAAGMVWVARRETLARTGIYDARIMGGGDKLVFCAACGRMDDYVRAYVFNPCEQQHYISWAKPFFDAVRGRIGFLGGDAYHLWHGSLGKRDYGARYAGFEELGFDPYDDIARSSGGAWHWSSDKPALHDFVHAFFERRRESSGDRIEARFGGAP